MSIVDVLDVSIEEQGSEVFREYIIIASAYRTSTNTLRQPMRLLKAFERNVAKVPWYSFFRWPLYLSLISSLNQVKTVEKKVSKRARVVTISSTNANSQLDSDCCSGTNSVSSLNPQMYISLQKTDMKSSISCAAPCTRKRARPRHRALSQLSTYSDWILTHF